MKIYNTNLNEFNRFSGLDEFLIKKDTAVKIYSDSGIFKFHKNNFVKLYPIDKEVETVIVDDVKYLLDSSYFKLGTQQFQIPTNHFIERTNVYIYRLRKNAFVDLVLIKSQNTNEFVDIYFSTKEKFYGVKEDIDTFLSMLN
jgi:hypothetical protein